MYDCMGPEHMKVLMAYHDGQPISGVIPIFYGNKTWYLYGASSNQHRNLMPNYLLQWEMIKMAIARKDDIYDFRGVSGVVDENHPQYAPFVIKLMTTTYISGMRRKNNSHRDVGPTIHNIGRVFFFSFFFFSFIAKPPCIAETKSGYHYTQIFLI